MRGRLIGVVLVSALWANAAFAQISTAFEEPLGPLDAQQSQQFLMGKRLFRSPWLMPPAVDDADFIGLGPTYNEISCLGCHVSNGRAAAPESDGQPLHGMLVRLSIAGVSAHGGPHPTPAYGDQLNDHAIPGIPAEGRAVITYENSHIHLADGTDVSLRKPHVAITDTAFGPIGAETMTSLRMAQPVFGDGLLEAIPESEIVALAQAQAVRHGPVHGRPNRVWDVSLHKTVLGRFGWKANQPTLMQQSAAAANGDMGLTSVLFPLRNCPDPQGECRLAPVGPQPSLSAKRLGELVAYLAALAPPAPRGSDQPEVQRGSKLFANIGCEDCHHATWQVDKPERRQIHPYTDLLLHDMGQGLSDGRPDFKASGRDWRTAPLWGIGLTQRVNPSAVFLHDGRARTLVEAIVWHGGEAEAAKQKFLQLSITEKSALVAFLNSL